jgi:outer membrane protein OmpA-like peptidoglycan-associated protein
MLLKKAILVTTVCSALIACQNGQVSKTGIGAGLGAAVGAGLGTLVGGDDRRNAIIGAGVGALAGGVVGNYMDKQQADLEQDLAGSGATVAREGDNLMVNLPGNITFATDSAQIQPQFYGTLNEISQTLNKYPNTYLNVIGHTDSTGDANYNQALSERRAASVSSYFVSQGVMQQRIATQGRGESQPIASNDTPEGRQANRRVQIEIIPIRE